VKVKNYETFFFALFCIHLMGLIFILFSNIALKPLFSVTLILHSYLGLQDPKLLPIKAARTILVFQPIIYSLRCQIERPEENRWRHGLCQAFFYLNTQIKMSEIVCNYKWAI
jgi:hypothetical protein